MAASRAPSTDAQLASASGLHHAAEYGERRRSELLDSMLTEIIDLLRGHGTTKVDVIEIDGRPPTDWDNPQSVNGLREYLRERFEAEDVTVRRGESESSWKRKFGIRWNRDLTHGDFTSLDTFRVRFL